MTDLILTDDFQKVFELTPVPMVILAVDDDFTIAGMNESYLRITMTRREAIVGKSIFKAFPGTPDGKMDDSLRELRHSLEYVRERGETHTMPLIKYDIQGEDGHFKERYWSATHTPIMGTGEDGNQVKYVLQHTEDVTRLVLEAQKNEKRDDAHRRLEDKTARMENEIVRRVHELEMATIKLEESEKQLRIVADQAQTWQSRYEAAIEASGQIMYDWNPVTNEVLFAGNVQTILGYDVADINGPLEKWLSVIHPNDVEAFNREIKRVVRERVPFRLTFRVIRNDGRVIYCEDHGNFFRDVRDNVLRMVGFVRDVTRDKETELVLLDSEERFRTLADTISHLAWIADDRGEIVWYNKRWLEYTGTTLEQMLSGYRVILPEVRDKVREKYLKHIQAGEPWEDTFPLKSASGEYRWFLSRSMPIKDADGRITKWFGTNTDITEQLETEKALREREERLAELNVQLERARDEALAASEAKSTFLAIMSHELRTPLNAVIGYAEMLRDDALSGTANAAEIATDLDRIAGSGQHLLHLISDILDFSKIEAGKMELSQDIVDVQLLVREAADAVAPMCLAKDNKLELTGGELGASVHGDYVRLKQILINLLGNAAKFTDKGNIELRYGADKPAAGSSEKLRSGYGMMTLWFEVEDSGIGIPEANLPWLYERFRQGDSSHTRRHGGTGLGLAITKRLVELMNGTIDVTSVVGKGTTFRVSLPVKAVEIDKVL